LSLLKVFFQVAKTCFAVFLDESALVSNAVCVVLVYVLAVEIENGVFDSEIVGDSVGARMWMVSWRNFGGGGF
jgi:hypothetical protein